MIGPTPIRRRFVELYPDRRGATIVEFAFVAPVMCLVLVGTGDIAHTLYMKAVMQGVLQKTARDASLESGTAAAAQTSFDQKIIGQVKAIANNADVQIDRRYYRTFTDASTPRPETWTDTNTNGKCDAGEPYVDYNGNTHWDKDGQANGQGSAKDATLLTVTVTYPSFFPLWKFLDVPDYENKKIVAKTILRNQPYADQGVTNTVRNCT